MSSKRVDDHNPWRQRCPKGHASLQVHSSSYRCRSCERVYDGRPYDESDVDEFPIEGDRPRPDISWQSIVMVMARLQSHETRSKWFQADELAGELGTRMQQVAGHWPELLDRELVERYGSTSQGGRYALTEKGHAVVEEFRAGTDRGQLNPLEMAALVAALSTAWLILTFLVVVLS